MPNCTPRGSPHRYNKPKGPTLMASETGLMGALGRGRRVQVPPHSVSQHQLSGLGFALAAILPSHKAPKHAVKDHVAVRGACK